MQNKFTKVIPTMQGPHFKNLPWAPKGLLAALPNKGYNLPPAAHPPTPPTPPSPTHLPL